MSEASVREYAAAVRVRYVTADRAKKSEMLTEFCEVTGYHRKSAIRLLRHPSQPPGKRSGRPREYGADVSDMLTRVWHASDHVCSKRLAPFLPELVLALERHGELHLRPSLRAQLITLSPATIDRLLKPARLRRLSHPYTTVRSPTLIRQMIPTRTFGDWTDVPLGYMEADLVAHCGETTRGFYLNTLVAVEARTGWVECVAVWGKHQDRVVAAIDRVRRQVPFKLLGIHTDNGGEFLNYKYLDYCKRFGLDPTHGRAYKKNDQPRVEQRNWQVVRRLIGYDRFASRAAYQKLNEVYTLTRLYTNFFQPIRKVVHRGEGRPRRRKVYDRAQTPYRRLLEAGVLTGERERELARQYLRLNPLHLLQQIRDALLELGHLAMEDPATRSLLAAKARLLNAKGDEERSRMKEQTEAATG